MKVLDSSQLESQEVVTRRLLGQLFGSHADGQVQVRLWNDTTWPTGVSPSRQPEVVIVLNHPGALRSMFLPGTERGLAEAYLYGDIDIEGNIEAVFSLGAELTKKATMIRKLGIGRDLLQLPSPRHPTAVRRGPANLRGRRHSIERDRQAVRYHYDVSNDFFALYLDPRMIYSCAYFRQAEDSLQQAQEQKLDLICRKLRLQRGQRLLDLGCGWGGLVLYAAQKYGVEATGITLSQPQADLANERIQEAGLQGQCRIEVMDYRQLTSTQPYDAISSVGMFEHVGREKLQEYFEWSYDLLKPGGVFLNHGIARGTMTPESAIDPSADSFSNVYVFPDSDLEPIHYTLQAGELAGFEVRDVESLREHYTLTLRHWVRNLEQNHQQALQYVDEFTYRVWRMYMSGSAHGFGTRRLNIYQVLFLKPHLNGVSNLPLTREDWYA